MLIKWQFKQWASAISGLATILFISTLARAEKPNFTCSSPLGTETIAFISDRSQQQQIYLMDTDGSNLQQLTELEDADLSDLDWSPDDQHLAFVNHADIYVIDIETLEIHQLTTREDITENFDPSWSPDGQQIAYISAKDGPYDIRTMGADGKDLGQMTYTDRYEISVEWTPGGNGIAYVPNSGANLTIFLQAISEPFEWDSPLLFGNVDDPQNILHSIVDLEWSPQSNYLSLQTDHGAYIINANGSDLRLIEGRETYSNRGAPSWSSDGCNIVFASKRDGNQEIYTLYLETETTQRLTDNAYKDFGPAWRPRVQDTELKAN